MTSNASSAERVSLADARSRSMKECWIAKRLSASCTWLLLVSNCSLSFDMPPPDDASAPERVGDLLGSIVVSQIMVRLRTRGAGRTIFENRRERVAAGEG